MVKTRSLGGIITEKDLADYETIVDDAPLISTLLPGDLEMCGPPPPSSFVVTQSLIVTMGGNSIFLLQNYSNLYNFTVNTLNIHAIEKFFF